MSHLSKYVEAILHPELNCDYVIDDVKTRVKQWNEDEVEVTQEISTYHFTNGAVIKRVVEQNHEPVELENCAEGWIMYMVMQQNQTLPDIRPKRIQFNSSCREAFWLRYFRDPNSGHSTLIS